ncbi:ATP-dependent protease ClpP protease subunit [Angulomicrobium tetraedrale]|uniref:ATP-dependent Clp protease proteolytic subunit n=1 Tax=Ancylobacter tetraedralis TaxID=217068 RepID=A0A839Z9W8_9HYPH|nr:head maturation protease, ClpP-related [Ancylobacter tetraedralis]MBB3771534.1 ATP-dependent protease ClpP protease subunit [Ancylobacter tetraedralis]
MAVIVEDGKLRLSGYVGDYYFEDGFTAADVVLALAGFARDEEVDVYINSGGGVATEGAAIHAVLRDRPGPTNIIVEGIAASAASLIAMAGDAVTMSAGSIMMIHDPSGYTIGTSADHSKTVEQLEALATAYARVYAEKSGKTEAECREIMKRETWLTPEQAVAEGFADATTATKAVPVAAFDYRTFDHAPPRLVALAKRKNWAFQARDPAAPPAPPRQKEKTMTEPTGGEDAAEIKRLREELAQMKAATQDRERRDAILALDEAKGREAQAKALCDTGITIEQAKAVLAAAPKAAAPEDDEDGDDLPDPKAYERSRAAGAGLGGGGGNPPKAKVKIDRAAIFAARAKQVGA